MYIFNIKYIFLDMAENNKDSDFFFDFFSICMPQRRRPDKLNIPKNESKRDILRNTADAFNDVFDIDGIFNEAEKDLKQYKVIKKNTKDNPIEFLNNFGISIPDPFTSFVGALFSRHSEYSYPLYDDVRNDIIKKLELFKDNEGRGLQEKKNLLASFLKQKDSNQNYTFPSLLAAAKAAEINDATLKLLDKELGLVGRERTQRER